MNRLLAVALQGACYGLGPGLAPPAPLTSQHLAQRVTGLFSPGFSKLAPTCSPGRPSHPLFREVPSSLWTLESPLVRRAEAPGPLTPLSSLWMDV